jgi:hypothetical protein
MIFYDIKGFTKNHTQKGKKTEWINIDTLPLEIGMYWVKRKWSEDFNCIGSCYFNGEKFEDELMEACGEITHWRIQLQ